MGRKGRRNCLVFVDRKEISTCKGTFNLGFPCQPRLGSPR